MSVAAVPRRLRSPVVVRSAHDDASACAFLPPTLGGGEVTVLASSTLNL
jgi:hypothetical protein